MPNCQGANFNLLHLGVGTAGAIGFHLGLSRLLAREGIPQQITQIGLRFWGCGAAGLGCALGFKLLTDRAREEEPSLEATQQLQEAQESLADANRARLALQAEQLSLQRRVADNFHARVVRPNEREAEIATLRSEKEQVDSSLEKANAEVGRLEREIGSLKNEAEQAELARKEIEASLNRVKKTKDPQLLKLDAEVSKLKEELQGAKSKAELAQKEAGTKLSKLEAEKKKTDAEVSKLKEELQSAKSKAELAQKEAQEKLSKLKSERKRVDASLEAANTKVEEAQRAQEEAEQQLSKLQSENKGKLEKSGSQVFDRKSLQQKTADRVGKGVLKWMEEVVAKCIAKDPTAIQLLISQGVSEEVIEEYVCGFRTLAFDPLVTAVRYSKGEAICKAIAHRVDKWPGSWKEQLGNEQASKGLINTLDEVRQNRLSLLKRKLSLLSPKKK